MSKFSCMGDLHLRMYNDSQYTADGLPLKLQEIFDVFKNMCEYSIKNKIYNIALLGDINDQKHVLNARIYSIFKDMLNNFSNIKFHIIPGNHDITSQGNIESAVDVLKGPDNVFVYNKPTIINNVEFIPYTSNLKQDIKNSKGCDVLFSHFSISSVALSTGSSLSDGEFEIRDLDKWKLKILGDIHYPQKLNNNIWYTGCPVPLTRAENNEQKRFLVVDTETLEVESVDTTGYRKYHTITITEENKNNIDQIINDIKNLQENNDFVTVKTTIPVIPEKLQDLSETVNIVDEYQEETIVRGITSVQTIEEQMKKYLEIEVVNNPEKYLNLGLSILKDNNIK